ncbi:MAG: hypothetical protein IPJ30_13760 [Acidobacteria bacterium]|nr:hypothetical protein [Acidobacteriota bacterium]
MRARRTSRRWFSKRFRFQQGRTPTIVLTDDETNSITLRDTAENIELMEIN